MRYTSTGILEYVSCVIFAIKTREVPYAPRPAPPLAESQFINRTSKRGVFGLWGPKPGVGCRVMGGGGCWYPCVTRCHQRQLCAYFDIEFLTWLRATACCGRHLNEHIAVTHRHALKHFKMLSYPHSSCMPYANKLSNCCGRVVPWVVQIVWLNRYMYVFIYLFDAGGSNVFIGIIVKWAVKCCHCSVNEIFMNILLLL